MYKKNLLSVLVVFLISFSAAADNVKTNSLSQITSIDPVIKNVESIIEKVRGLNAKRPIKYSVRNKIQIMNYIKERVDREYTKEQLAYEELVLKDLELIPQNFDYVPIVYKLLEEQVAGVYAPESKELFVADWLDPDLQQVTLAHEMEHGFQDQYFDLQKLTKNKHNTDKQLAISALIEGDATAVLFDYVLIPVGKQFTSLPSEYMQQIINTTLSSEPGSYMSKVPPYIRESLLFPYINGLNFIKSLYINGGWEKVNKAFVFVPSSSEQIMHPDKFFTKDNPVEFIVPKVLLKNYKNIYEDTFGEYNIYQFLKQFLPDDKAKKGSEGWGGDRLAVYNNSKVKGFNDHYTILTTVWDTDEDAVEFYQAIQEGILTKYPQTNLQNGQVYIINPNKTFGINLNTKNKKVKFIVTNSLKSQDVMNELTR